jgi:two-component system sensor histidine kinase HydH
MTFTMFQTQPADSPQHIWGIAILTGAALLAVVGLVIFFMRRFFQSTREDHQVQVLSAAPSTQNPSAFMTASMQGVILKLREQEKELERLHKIEKERAEHTERLSEEVTRNMPAGLVVVNAIGNISSANPAAELVLGVRGLGFRRYSEALGENSDLTRLIAECLANGKVFRREEVKHEAPGGETRRLGVTISPIRKGTEKISGVICLLSDLTELATLQQQVQWKENLAALGELSAGIAHEFKNALATISGYAQMIRAETMAGESFDYAERILEQTQNITHVVTEFLKYARPLEISNEPVGLQAVVERVVTEVGEANPQVRIRHEGPFGNVAGDEGLLRQALLNLARNAAEACAEAANGGKVLLRGELSKGEERATQRITVYDNGPGIPATTLPKLFRPFFTTKANGTGLGLAVVQKIIVQHGGRVEARNRSEGGAAFIITLPAPRSVPEAVESSRTSI